MMGIRLLELAQKAGRLLPAVRRRKTATLGICPIELLAEAMVTSQQRMANPLTA